MAKRTVFQRLNTIFGSEGGKQLQNQTNKYSINNDVLIKTQSKEEYDTVKLQQQQNKYLRNVWRKVDGEIFQQSIHYETTRIGSYTDFENMEFYPEIAAALDVMMEEATTTNDKGKILNIYSDSNRIKGILEDLFFNRLDIHVSLPMWTRNTCKYGNNFVFLNIDDDKGILGAKQLPNFEIERHEGDIINSLLSGRRNVDASDNEENKVKFHWRGKDITFNSWQIAHFRLLSDDKHLPYGCSVLEKARRIWKLLQLSEDAMLVYRVTRAPERRVYKIFVGNIDEEDVPAYVDEIANRFKRTPIIDPKTGQVDLRYNVSGNDQDFFIPVRDENAPTPIDTLPGACISLDTNIPLLDGRTIELSEIINEWDSGNRDLWVYSCNPETGELAPGIITWAGITRKDAEVIKITLDNGKSITTTPDHKWVHRTNGFIEAKDLKVGDSLMPFYRGTKKIKNNTNDYEVIWDSFKQEWVYTHRMVADILDEHNVIETYTFNEKYKSANKNIRHHKDHNRFNNNPNNLVWMNGTDHIKYHQSVIMETMWGNPKENIEKNKNRTELYNHKIVSIEWLNETIDTGTITVDGNEIYHNYHTFATESGVFIKNSNLDQISDIMYLQRKLFTALRVPKQFLNFDEAQGEGKNLSLQDVRFSRTINRIQQAMLAELNKIAIIHLYLLGFEDDLDNFTLTLNNPSTQAEMLKTEQLQMKMSLFKDAVSDAGNGFAPMSMTRAHREILGWSDDEIKQDLLEQRIEKAASAELENTSNVIKYTGMFDKVDTIYGDIEVARSGSAGGDDSSGDDSGGGGSSGGGGFGGGSLDFGSDEGSEEGGDEGSEEGGDELGGDEGSEEVFSDEGGESGELSESIFKKPKLISEQIKNKTLAPKNTKTNTNKFDNLIKSVDKSNDKTIMSERVKIYDKSLKVNEDINGIIKDIDRMLDE
jgi:hypothetical protein